MKECEVGEVASSLEVLNTDASDVEGDTARADSVSGESEGVVEPDGDRSVSDELRREGESECEGSTGVVRDISTAASSKESSAAKADVGGSAICGPQVGSPGAATSGYSTASGGSGV